MKTENKQGYKLIIRTVIMVDFVILVYHLLFNRGELIPVIFGLAVFTVIIGGFAYLVLNRKN
jgi:hypothetical protein